MNKAVTMSEPNDVDPVGDQLCGDHSDGGES